MAWEKRRKIRELKERARELARNFDEPFSANDVAKALGIQWNTAVKLLLELGLEGEIEVLKTTKSYVFIPKANQGKEIELKV